MKFTNNFKKSKILDLDEKIKFSYKPGLFYDWKIYLLSFVLIPIGIGLIVLLLLEINRLNTMYVFTSKKIIQKSNLFSQKKYIPYKMIKELHFNQTKADKIFNTGTIIIETNRRKKSELIMKNLPKPYEIKKFLEKEINT